MPKCYREKGYSSIKGPIKEGLNSRKSRSRWINRIVGWNEIL